MAPPMTERDSRVVLCKTTRPEDFRDFYWLKRELQDFCRSQGLATSGGKREIAERIEHFLRTGRDLGAVSRRPAETAAARRVNRTAASALTMATRAPAGFRCTQESRRFFEQHLGKRFRFSVALQDFIKAHPGVTFRQIADEWQRQDGLKRAGAWQPAIAPQFEYNQFTRDYHADPRNQGKTHRDCLEAWKRQRARRGDNKYRSPDHSGGAPTDLMPIKAAPRAVGILAAEVPHVEAAGVVGRLDCAARRVRRRR